MNPKVIVIKKKIEVSPRDVKAVKEREEKEFLEKKSKQMLEEREKKFMEGFKYNPKSILSYKVAKKK
jgi:hypothetical protein